MFSEQEREIIDLINEYEWITISDLVEAYFGKEKPLDPNNKIAQTIRRIRNKCEYYKLDWTIEGSGAGRGGRTVWVEKRN